MIASIRSTLRHADQATQPTATAMHGAVTKSCVTAEIGRDASSSAKHAAPAGTPPSTRGFAPYHSARRVVGAPDG